MAQRKGGRPTAQPKRPATPGKNGSPGGRNRPPAATPVARGVRPARRKPGRPIIDQRRRPWGLISTAIALVLFAAVVLTYALTRPSTKSPSEAGAASGGSMAADPQSRPYIQPQLEETKAITGLSYKQQPNHNHVPGTVSYTTTPPTGGDHSPVWADCTGTVYATPIANENAVHMMEHGAIWITYNPQTVATGDLAQLKSLVQGTDRMALTPYPDLRAPISLQAWNYQLFVDAANDPRVSQFVTALRYNPKSTPEPNATCSNPSFQASRSKPGQPYEGG